VREVKIDKIKEAVRKCMVSFVMRSMFFYTLADRDKPNKGGWVCATEVPKKREDCFRLSTGSKQWDGILNGGFQSTSVSEVYGEYRCGKTQLAHILCVIAQLPKHRGGANGKVAYLGTAVLSPSHKPSC
jgi:meiotic recombination protein DMC1